MNSRKSFLVVSIRQSLILGCVLIASTAYAEPLTGRVVGVSDGDTITVLDAQNQQHKIRVAGIDAPEKKQPFGQRSKEHLSDLVYGKEVEIVGNKTDRYGRTVAKVMAAPRGCEKADCPRTVDAGLGQIEAGLAWWYRKYAREQSPEDRASYAAGELKAAETKLGLWSEANPMPPWDWRHSKGRSRTP